MCDMCKQREPLKLTTGALGPMVVWIPQRAAVDGKSLAIEEAENGALQAAWRLECVAEALRAEGILNRQSRARSRTPSVSEI